MRPEPLVQKVALYTILYGRGVGVHEHDTFFGAPIEPEKEILIILIAKADTDTVLEALIRAGELNEPGRGITFVTDVVKVAEMVHLGKQIQSSWVHGSTFQEG